jgi:RimJ/RimL family protein N-acetyltransferase
MTERRRLVGERVVLRPVRPADADVLARGFVDDPMLGAMLGLEPEQENAEWLRGTFPADEAESDSTPKSHWFAVADPKSDEAIGEVGLVGISWPNRRAGLSIFMLPGSRRAGLGHEAIDLLVDWAHRELGLHRIEIRTLPENAAMRALAEATDFTCEGIQRDYTYERGRFVDHVVYARLPA